MYSSGGTENKKMLWRII